MITHLTQNHFPIEIISATLPRLGFLLIKSFKNKRNTLININKYFNIYFFFYSCKLIMKIKYNICNIIIKCDNKLID